MYFLKNVSVGFECLNLELSSYHDNFFDSRQATNARPQTCDLNSLVYNVDSTVYKKKKLNVMEPAVNLLLPSVFVSSECQSVL